MTTPRNSQLLLDSNHPIPQLKDFQIEKRLGSGSYATVYRAFLKKNPNEVFAIKCIKRKGLNESSIENLLREIKILKQIKHDFIVQLKDHQWDQNYIYLILEYCSGGDLSNFIKSKRTIPEKYVKRFVQQIASSLKHLHSKGIAHMDLKPQNILLTSVDNPCLKLADFGFAQFMRERDHAKSLRGSPLYMAPEILKNKCYDSRVDLWSVGVILHEVIFGYAPFLSNSFEELEQKIMGDTPIKIPTHIALSEPCKDLLRGLLQRNPQDRISFEAFFNHPFVDLEHMGSNESLSKASDLITKATRADKRGEFALAKQLYQQSIEYLMPAIQYEKDLKKKQELREKVNFYLKRAEEINDSLEHNKQISNSSSISKATNLNDNRKSKDLSSKLNDLYIIDDKSSITQSTQSHKIVSIPIHFEKSTINYSNTTLAASNSSIISTSQIEANIIPVLNNTSLAVNSIDANYSLNNNGALIDKLLKFVDGNAEMQNAIKMCIDADEKIPTAQKYQELFEQYQSAISVMMPFVKVLPKESEACKLFKIHIEKWLSKAEKLKEKILEQENFNKLQLLKEKDSINKEDDENSPYMKQCILQ